MKVSVKKSKAGGSKKSSTSVTLNGGDLYRLGRRMVSERVGLLAAYGKELRSAFDSMVKDKKLTRQEAEAQFKAAMDGMEKTLTRAGEAMRGTWGRGLHLVGLATVQDVATIETRLDRIEKRLDKLARPARKTSRKAKRPARPRAVQKVEKAAA